MSEDECKEILEYVSGTLVIDLFGGSGIFSCIASRDGFAVMYNDNDEALPLKKFRNQYPISHYDFREFLCVFQYLIRKDTTIFVDPPYYKMRWKTSEWDSFEIHKNLAHTLFSVRSQVIMLNSIYFSEFLIDKNILIKNWNYRQKDKELKGKLALFVW